MSNFTHYSYYINLALNASINKHACYKVSKNYKPKDVESILVPAWEKTFCVWSHNFITEHQQVRQAEHNKLMKKRCPDMNTQEN